MKTLLTLLALSATANAMYTYNQVSRDIALDDCARSLNVYTCKWVAVPATPPRVVTVQPDLLPPPVLASVEGK
jgi:hypothetical protein